LYTFIIYMVTTFKHFFLLGIGSNLHQELNMQKAVELLLKAVSKIVFSRWVWTEPIGIESPPFLNCLAYGQCSADLMTITNTFKTIETSLGSTKEARLKGEVAIDIDLLQWDFQKMRPADWERPYVKMLWQELKNVGNIPSGSF